MKRIPEIEIPAYFEKEFKNNARDLGLVPKTWLVIRQLIFRGNNAVHAKSESSCAKDNDNSAKTSIDDEKKH